MKPRSSALASVLLGIVPFIATSPAAVAAIKPAALSPGGPVDRAKMDVIRMAEDKGGVWSPELKLAYLRYARAQTLAACAARNIQLPQDFLAWIEGDPVLSASVYGTRADPLPILLGLRSLEIDLGKQIVRQDYPQLALAFAINDSFRGWSSTPAVQNDTRKLNMPLTEPDLSPRPPLKIAIAGDPRVRIDTKDPKRRLDRDDHIINFLEDHAEIEVEVMAKDLPPLEYDSKGIAKKRKERDIAKKIQRKPTAADVIASPALQQEFNAYMKGKGQNVAIDCGDQVVSWNSTKSVPGPEAKKITEALALFRDAYRAKGRLPKARDAAATPVESMAWFIRNDRYPFSAVDRKDRQWPRFPLNAPWPVLMMLADDDQPLREREEIWTKFRDSGEMKTYGEYIGDIAQQYDMQSARRLAPSAFDYGTIQMMWKDGGVCGTMASMGARTLRICGIPAATAGQPGHCALVQMEFNPKSGQYACKGGQYATGGDEVTNVHYNWYFGDAARPEPMVYHQTVAWSVNHGLPAFLDSLLCLQISRLLPESDTARRIKLLEQGLDLNPYSIALADAAISQIKQPDELAQFVGRCNARLDLAAKPPKAPDAKHPKAPDTKLYRATLADKVNEATVALNKSGGKQPPKGNG
ncbi:MAG: hypothetical protein V4819_10230 [Verrucomicrobiota bacterium]